MLFLLLIATTYKTYASPVPLGPEIFSATPLILLFRRSSPCECNPPDRTLADIVVSCVLTIFACVYTSLHPNVPDPTATKWEKRFERLRMSLYASIAPEAVIWWAMRQWYGARLIAKQMNEIAPGELTRSLVIVHS